MDQRNRKLLLVGLDGAEPSLVEKWIQEGRLANMGKMIKEGMYGCLKSTVPTNSACAWASLVSGKNAGKHGIFGFSTRDADGYRTHPTSAAQRRSEAIWDMLNRSNKKSIVMNVPLTFPPEEVNGIMISGFPSPSGENVFTYPSFLSEEMRERGYRIDIDLDDYELSKTQQVFRDSIEVAKKRMEVALDLLKKEEWDFFFVVFTCLDRLQHLFWSALENERQSRRHGETIRRNAIPNTYEELDSFIGMFMENVPETCTIMIVSDHGFGPIRKRFHMNTWLQRLNLLRVKRRWNLFFVYDWLGKLSASPVTDVLAKVRLEKAVGRIKEEVVKSNLSVVSWSESKAYFDHDLGGIFVNLRNREPAGIVEPGREYEEIRNLIIRELKKLKDPETGNFVISSAFKREDLFSGPFTENAPDILFTVEEYFPSSFITRDSLTTPMDRRLSGDHKLYGILSMKGPNINDGFKAKSAEITDICPTILYLMGIPIPFDMDGRVLVEAIDPSFLESNPIQYQKATKQTKQHEYEIDKEERDQIRKRLRELGYIE